MRSLLTLVLLLACISETLAQTCPNRCLDFDGTGDYLATTSAPLTGNANFTVEARFVCTSSGTSFRRLFGLGGTNTRIEVGESNGLLRFLRQSSTGSATTGIPFASIRNNGWHHLAARRNGNLLTFFVDCDSVYSTTFTGTLNIDVFRVGSPGIAVTGTVWWDGLIDEVRVWNTPRTPAQIDATCGCGLQGNEAGLVLYYDFDQAGINPGGNNAGQTTVQDETVHNNDGTLQTFTLDGAGSNWVCGDANFQGPCGGCAAEFSFSVNQCDRSVQFTNQTPPPVATSFSWNFGDGTTSTQFSPNHVYATPGVYNVCLTALALTGGVICTTCHTVTVAGDTEPPIANCRPPFSLALPALGMVPITTSMVNNGSTDNCGIASMSLNVNSFDCSAACSAQGLLGPQTVVLTVTDNSGNTATCSSLVSVEDNLPPMAACRNVQVSVGTTIPVVLNPSDVDNGSADNCDIVSKSLSPNTFSCPTPCPRTVTVTLRVTDCSGNSASCTAQVLVQDVLPPVINCPASTTVNVPPGAACPTTVPNLNAGLSDNCSLNGLTHSLGGATSGSGPGDAHNVLFNDGVTTVTYTVRDLCGNTSTCTFTVAVVCETTPVCQCGGFSNLQVDPLPAGGTVLPALCDTTLHLPCPAGAGVNLSGVFACSSPSCAPSSLVWELRNSSGTLLASGALGGASFTLPIAGSLLANPGTYHVILRGDCGQTTCQCGLWLRVDECPSDTDYLCGMAMVTCYSGGGNGVVAAIKDVTNKSTLSADVGTYVPYSIGGIKMWTRGTAGDNLGEVFGIAMDPLKNIYLTATSVYGPNLPPGFNGSGGVYKINGSTLAVDNTWAVSLPNSSGPCTSLQESGCGSTINYTGTPGLGNICYDPYNDVLYASNFEDGAVYKIAPATGVFSKVYDPVLLAADDGSAGFAPLGERIWGVGVVKNPLGETEFYYAVWATDMRNKNLTSSTVHNTIRRVKIDNAGNFIGGSDAEIIQLSFLPDAFSGSACRYSNPQFSNPVSDIEFSADGNTMLLAERTMHGDMISVSSGSNFRWAHNSRLLEYKRSGMNWVFSRRIDIGGKPMLMPPVLESNNSAGGVDFAPGFGREKIACDSMIWATGDYLHQAGMGVLIYGMQGFAAANPSVSNATSYLVDFDQDLINYDKSLIGDVDIFKCRCTTPCDAVSATALKTKGGGCCYDLQIQNATPDYFTAIGIHAFSGGTLESNPQEAPGWSQQSYGPSPFFIPTAGDYVPAGTFNVTHFCLENLSADVQQVEVLYYVGAEVVCRDTLTLRCDACVEILVKNLECTGLNQYQLTFNIQTGAALPWTTGSVVFAPPAGMSVSPSGLSLPDLPPNTLSGPYTVALSGPLTGLTCFTATIHEQDVLAGEPDIRCCSDTFCIDLPGCDPCDSMLTYATAAPADLANGGECCWNITLHNPPNYFVAAQTSILTPGWEFSAINNYAGSGWLIGVNSPPTIIHWDPTVPLGNYVPDGVVLPSVCLDYTGTGAAPQPVVIQITWVAADQTICTDEVYLSCPEPAKGCVVLQDDTLVCSPNGGYVYTFTVFNHTDMYGPAFTAGQVSLVPVSGGSISPATFDATIAPGDHATFTASINGNAGDQLCFYAVLHERNDDSLHIYCCPTMDTICLTLPPCSGCELSCIYNTVVTLSPPTCSATITPATILENDCPGALVLTVIEHFGPTMAVHVPSYTIPPNSPPLLLVYVVNPVTHDSCWGYVTVTRDPNCPPETFTALALSLFPNPASQQINLAFDAPLPAAASVRILDLTGRVCLRPSDLPAGAQQTVLDVSSLTPGVYAVDVVVWNLVALRRRFVVQRGDGRGESER